MCVLSILIFVSTDARPIGHVDAAGVASAGLKRDGVKTESNECTHSCEPIDSNFGAKCGGSVKWEGLDTCSVEVNVCGAGVDGHDSSNSLKRCVSSTRSEDNVASNEDVDVMFR